jgi:peptidyl-prolyl cis-trans isomerase B (cyclophilin B)
MQGKRSGFRNRLSGGLLALMVGLLPLILAACGDAPNAGTAGGEKYMIIETAKGRIVARLHTEPAAGVSKTIANFEQKANSGAFNGRMFHRVEDWVIQGGDPLGNGRGGGDMPSEYNQLSFGAGALGVARGGDPTINNDSQFFITKSPSPHLDGQYTNFGQVIEGMDVVSQIAIGDKITRMTVSNQK